MLLRPLVQDTLFPTVCYVAGPSELAYLAQLRGIYEHFGVPMPLLYPRASATLIDSAAARFPGQIRGAARRCSSHRTTPPQSPLAAVAAPESVDEALADATTRSRADGALVEVMPAIDPTLAGAAKTTLGKMEHDLKRLQAR